MTGREGAEREEAEVRYTRLNVSEKKYVHTADTRERQDGQTRGAVMVLSVQKHHRSTGLPAESCPVAKFGLRTLKAEHFRAPNAQFFLD